MLQNDFLYLHAMNPVPEQNRCVPVLWLGNENNGMENEMVGMIDHKRYAQLLVDRWAK